MVDPGDKKKSLNPVSVDKLVVLAIRQRWVILMVGLCAVGVVLLSVGLYWRIVVYANIVSNFASFVDYTGSTTNCPTGYASHTAFDYPLCSALKVADMAAGRGATKSSCSSLHSYATSFYCPPLPTYSLYIWNVTNAGVFSSSGTAVTVAKLGPYTFNVDCTGASTVSGTANVSYYRACTYAYTGGDSDLDAYVITPNLPMLSSVFNNSITTGVSQSPDFSVVAKLTYSATTYVAPSLSKIQSDVLAQLVTASFPNNYDQAFYDAFVGGSSSAVYNQAFALLQCVATQQTTCYATTTALTALQSLAFAKTLGYYVQVYLGSLSGAGINLLSYTNGGGLFVNATIRSLIYGSAYTSGIEPLSNSQLYMTWSLFVNDTASTMVASTNTQAAKAFAYQPTTAVLGPSISRTGSASPSVQGGSYRFRGRGKIYEYAWSQCDVLYNGAAAVTIPPLNSTDVSPPQCDFLDPSSAVDASGLVPFTSARMLTFPSWETSGISVSMIDTPLMRPMTLSLLSGVSISGGTVTTSASSSSWAVAGGTSSYSISEGSSLSVNVYQVDTSALQSAQRISYCDKTKYGSLSNAGVIQRGQDCDINSGMLFMYPMFNNTPLIFSLPHFAYVTNAPTISGMDVAVPGSVHDSSFLVVEPQSGYIVSTSTKHQVSAFFPNRTSNNLLFTTYPSGAVVPVYILEYSYNVSGYHVEILAGYQSSLSSSTIGFIALASIGCALLFAGILVGLKLYKDHTISDVQRKRDKISLMLVTAAQRRASANNVGLATGGQTTALGGLGGGLDSDTLRARKAAANPKVVLKYVKGGI